MAHSYVSFESFVKPSHSELSNFRTVTNASVQKTLNALTTVGALMTLKDFTLSNARRFHSSMGNPLAVKGLTTSKTVPIKGLSLAKATGIDNISGKILKVAALAISPSLTYTINHAIISFCFPDDWKVARVLPLHRKGPRNLPDNYRQISILPAISKIIEIILYDQL